MKNIIFLCLFTLVAAAGAGAQSPEASAPALPVTAADTIRLLAREHTERLREKYALDAGQVNKMYLIQERKQRNLAEIEPFKTANPTLYRSKLNSIQQGTKASIRRMLNTAAQQQIYQQTKVEQRRQRSAKQQELTAQGAAKETIEAAVLAIYIE